VRALAHRALRRLLPRLQPAHQVGGHDQLPGEGPPAVQGGGGGGGGALLTPAGRPRRAQRTCPRRPAPPAPACDSARAPDPRRRRSAAPARDCPLGLPLARGSLAVPDAPDLLLIRRPPNERSVGAPSRPPGVTARGASGAGGAAPGEAARGPRAGRPAGGQGGEEPRAPSLPGAGRPGLLCIYYVTFRVVGFWEARDRRPLGRSHVPPSPGGTPGLLADGRRDRGAGLRGGVSSLIPSTGRPWSAAAEEENYQMRRKVTAKVHSEAGAPWGKPLLVKHDMCCLCMLPFLETGRD
ncbi:PREDICTED: cuticle collagen 2C-like, partial [Chinchilla lanigera]|uniref:cuticle collagen 2C-like n=1 Tax=Chinchilla lanigera TaxID=34839 RepID=UPI000697F340